MAEHTHRLVDLEIVEVSLVDKPANPDARVALFKRAPKEKMADENKNPDEIPVEHVGMFKRFLKFLAGEGTPEGSENPDANKSDSDDPASSNDVVDVVKESGVAETNDVQTDVNKAAADREALTKALEAERAERVALEKRLAEMEVANKRKETLARVAKDFSSLPGNREDVADVLLALEKCGEDVAKKAEEILKSANAALAESALFVEKGKSKAADEGSAIAKLNAAADRLMAEDKTLTKAQAFVKALEQNPELDAQYQAEKGA